jgi:GNAT superfamily N-acetyltransferase
MNAALRVATNADAASIADILLASRAAFLPYAPSPHSDDEVRAWVRDTLLPLEDVTVASVADHVVGFMAVHRAAGISWITQLYLRPSHVAQGIGLRLLDRALATVPRPIRLYTFQQNSGARRFYERNGFSPIQFTDGGANEERCPDVLYELAALQTADLASVSNSGNH